jgi:predicted GTPase
MIDATQGVTIQDVNIFHLVEKNNKGVVILVNKWDLIDKEKYNVITHDNYESALQKSGASWRRSARKSKP